MKTRVSMIGTLPLLLWPLLVGPLLVGAPAHAQWLPDSSWSEPVIIAPGDPETTLDPEEPWEEVLDIEDIPAPVTYDEVRQANELAAAATVPVFTHIPASSALIADSDTEGTGVATWVVIGDEDPVLITALAVVENASQIEVTVDGERIPARVIADARFGLALLLPLSPIAPEGRALAIHEVAAEDPAEVFSSVPGSTGSTLGTGEAEYAFYQVNTLGVSMGYPLVDRDGNLIGIGSHPYPLDPLYSLSVSSHSVVEFLDATRVDRME